MKNVIHRTADVLVIGAGMAGLSAAAGRSRLLGSTSGGRCALWLGGCRSGDPRRRHLFLNL
ncbi:MAG: hypothetical protein WCO60_11630 [Verrucomicrobiota bacterium]